MPFIGNSPYQVAFLTDTFSGNGSTTAFTMSVAPANTSSVYCVYLTTYRGKALPPFYIGSTSVKKIKNGYRGSVLSAAYKAIWKQELASNPELFSTKILSKHTTRQEALEHELNLQKDLDVVNSRLFINKALASGCFGNMGEEALKKMRLTKKAQGKEVGKKISAIRNNPEWKSTIGKEAALKLSKTKQDPTRADIEAQRNKKNSETVNSQKWKNTVGKERSKKISIAVRQKQDNDEWRNTKGVERKTKMMSTISSPEWKATVGAKANQKRSIAVSKAKSNPEWKLKNSTICNLCNGLYTNNVFARHQVKCKEKDTLVCRT
jgi:hypothetical protein